MFSWVDGWMDRWMDEWINIFHPFRSVMSMYNEYWLRYLYVLDL